MSDAGQRTCMVVLSDAARPAEEGRRSRSGVEAEPGRLALAAPHSAAAIAGPTPPSPHPASSAASSCCEAGDLRGLLKSENCLLVALREGGEAGGEGAAAAGAQLQQVLLAGGRRANSLGGSTTRHVQRDREEQHLSLGKAIVNFGRVGLTARSAPHRHR